MNKRVALTVFTMILLTGIVPELFAAVRVRARFGATSVSLPRGHVTVAVRGGNYFYHDGVFYQRARKGYVIVPGPADALITTLPAGHVTLKVGSSSYYYYQGVYYRHDPVRKGYLVVRAPAGAVVEDIPDGYKVVNYKGVRHYRVGGVYYRPVYKGSVIRSYRVVKVD